MQGPLPTASTQLQGPLLRAAARLVPAGPGAFGGWRIALPGRLPAPVVRTADRRRTEAAFRRDLDHFLRSAPARTPAALEN